MPAAPLECGTGYTQRRAGHAVSGWWGHKGVRVLFVALWAAVRGASVCERGWGRVTRRGGGRRGQGTESDGEKKELLLKKRPSTLESSPVVDLLPPSSRQHDSTGITDYVLLLGSDPGRNADEVRALGQEFVNTTPPKKSETPVSNTWIPGEYMHYGCSQIYS